MNSSDLGSLSVEALVDRFAGLCIDQDEAERADKRLRFNALFREMDSVDKELRARGRTARLRLLRLFDHSNLQVRLQAAKWSLGVAPNEARAVIEAVAVTSRFPQCLEAGMTLRSLDNGLFVPT